jgi:hypothetical protein
MNLPVSYVRTEWDGGTSHFTGSSTFTFIDSGDLTKFPGSFTCDSFQLGFGKEFNFQKAFLSSQAPQFSYDMGVCRFSDPVLTYKYEKNGLFMDVYEYSTAADLSLVEYSWGGRFFDEPTRLVADGWVLVEDLSTHTADPSTSSFDDTNIIASIDAFADSVNAQIDAITAANTASNTDLVSNTATTATNTGTIATNTGTTATNTVDIATNTGTTATNTGDIATNTGDIATNTATTATNTGAIATNTGTTAINTGTTATNTGSIADSTSTTATNTGAIVTNTGTIATNTGTIATNTGAIADGLDGLSAIASSIQTNTADTSSNSGLLLTSLDEINAKMDFFDFDGLLVDSNIQSDLDQLELDFKTEAEASLATIKKEVNVDSAMVSSSDFSTGAAEYPDFSFEVLGEIYSIDFEPFRYLLQLLGVLINISAGFIGIRILMRV